MKVQIYTVQTVEEALAVAALGVNHIGVTPAHHNLPGEIDYETARQIVAAIQPPARRVALSVDDSLDEIVKMVETVRPDILHLCGDIRAVPPAAVAELRRRIPGVEIMQAVPVVGFEAVQIAEAYQDVAEYLILDSKSEAINGIGAAGFTHDWNVSREIVRRSKIPVILAGGLSPENVAEAIRQVQPWGVDSLTHTNHPLPGGGFCKDLERIKAFVEAAREN